MSWTDLLAQRFVDHALPAPAQPVSGWGVVFGTVEERMDQKREAIAETRSWKPVAYVGGGLLGFFAALWGLSKLAKPRAAGGALTP